MINADSETLAISDRKIFFSDAKIITANIFRQAGKEFKMPVA